MQDDTTPEPFDGITSPIVSIPGGAEFLQIGLSTFYERMKEGEFEVVTLHGRTFVTRKSLDAYIARNTKPSKYDDDAEPSSKYDRHGIGGNKPPVPINAQPKPRPVKRRLTPGKKRRKRDDQRTAAP